MDDFLEQIEKHKDAFYRYIYCMAWDSGVVEDIFSSAVLVAYQNRDRFTPGTNFRAWMYRIITNKTFVANRQTARTPDRLEDHEYHISEMAEQPAYDAFLENGEDVLNACGDEVTIAFRCLSTVEKSCLLLRAIQGFSYKETAEILEIPIGTVMTHLSRGRAKLRQRLLKYAIDQKIVSPPLKTLKLDAQDEIRKQSDTGT